MTYLDSNTARKLVALFGLIIFMISGGLNTAEAADASVTFTVEWYDVGQDALEGLKGVNKVEKGFRDSKEINTVYFDSEKITIQEMEAALKDAGTYVETADE